MDAGDVDERGEPRVERERRDDDPRERQERPDAAARRDGPVRRRLRVDRGWVADGDEGRPRLGAHPRDGRAAQGHARCPPRWLTPRDRHLPGASRPPLGATGERRRCRTPRCRSPVAKRTPDARPLCGLRPVRSGPTRRIAQPDARDRGVNHLASAAHTIPWSSRAERAGASRTGPSTRQRRVAPPCRLARRSPSNEIPSGARTYSASKGPPDSLTIAPSAAMRTSVDGSRLLSRLATMCGACDGAVEELGQEPRRRSSFARGGTARESAGTSRAAVSRRPRPPTRGRPGTRPSKSRAVPTCPSTRSPSGEDERRDGGAEQEAEAPRHEETVAARSATTRSASTRRPERSSGARSRVVALICAHR